MSTKSPCSEKGRKQNKSSGPSTTEVARVLDVDGRRLRSFIEAHPRPTAEYIIQWADAGVEHEQLIHEWLLSIGALDREDTTDQGGDGL